VAATPSSAYKLRLLLSNTLTTFQLRHGDPLGYAAKVDGSTPMQSLSLNLYSSKYQYQVSELYCCLVDCHVCTQHDRWMFTECLLLQSCYAQLALKSTPHAAAVTAVINTPALLLVSFCCRCHTDTADTATADFYC
jgi:hypothetical protein